MLIHFLGCSTATYRPLSLSSVLYTCFPPMSVVYFHTCTWCWVHPLGLKRDPMIEPGTRWYDWRETFSRDALVLSSLQYTGCGYRESIGPWGLVRFRKIKTLLYRLHFPIGLPERGTVFLVQGGPHLHWIGLEVTSEKSEGLEPSRIPFVVLFIVHFDRITMAYAWTRNTLNTLWNRVSTL